VHVDCKGMPMGKEVDLLHKDLIAFAKEKYIGAEVT
jgi:hypothetical protein